MVWTKLRYITCTMDRRNFLELAAAGAGILPISRLTRIGEKRGQAVTALGPIAPEQLGRTLIHEHVLVDFIGADEIRPGRYDSEEVFLKALPHLRKVKSAGCDTLVDCTPAYIGRDPGLLRRLSQASGLQIVTNTGLYAQPKTSMCRDTPTRKPRSNWPRAGSRSSKMESRPPECGQELSRSA